MKKIFFGIVLMVILLLGTISFACTITATVKEIKYSGGVN
jgi:uncharacterized alpha/beta hydrolase family protein